MLDKRGVFIVGAPPPRVLRDQGRPVEILLCLATWLLREPVSERISAAATTYTHSSFFSSKNIMREHLTRKICILLDVQDVPKIINIYHLRHIGDNKNFKNVLLNFTNLT